jgi:hypothetical protein
VGNRVVSYKSHLAMKLGTVSVLHLVYFLYRLPLWDHLWRTVKTSYEAYATYLLANLKCPIKKQYKLMELYSFYLHKYELDYKMQQAH